MFSYHSQSSEFSIARHFVGELVLVDWTSDNLHGATLGRDDPYFINLASVIESALQSRYDAKYTQPEAEAIIEMSR